jgi:ATP-binding cassette subfamily B protein
LVIHRGELRERGTHAELLALGGLYARLYELQQMTRENGAAGTERATGTLA